MNPISLAATILALCATSGSRSISVFCSSAVRHFCSACGLLLFLAASGSNLHAQEVEVRRFALIVGANSGGPERVELQYATSDAISFGEVMLQMGGVKRQNNALLLNPTHQTLRSTFSKLAQQMVKAKEKNHRVEFLFYFSGHSDEEGLLLGKQKITYRETRTTIDQLSADVKIAVLDSCASGAFTRLKGGKYKPPFLLDASTSVTGHAFLTSSSQDEVAQESDQIKASFFTHYLISGLRGGADFSNDGRVTLNEAYRFAFDETLARTESTRGGPQHPAYDIQLVGTGDLVMTDIRQTSATLSIGADIEGRIYLRDHQQRLVAELFKPKGRIVELGLVEGQYHIIIDRKGHLSRGLIELSPNEVTQLEKKHLTTFDPDRTVARGSSKKVSEPPSDQYRIVPFAVSLFPPADTNHLVKKKVINHLGLNFVLGKAAKIQGAQLGIGANWADEEVKGTQLSVGFNYGGDKLQGFQGSVGFNRVSEMYGIQGTVGANLVNRMEGAQMSVGFNMAPQTKGLQATVGANIASETKGAQLSVGSNISSDRLTGLQASVGPNFSSYIRGAQLSLVNISNQVSGAQIGLINIASGKVEGMQMGLINYADEADVSMGLVAITRKGGVHPQLWTSDIGLLNLGLRFDATYTYTFIMTGYHPLGEGESFNFGIGFGIKINLIEKIWLDIDISNLLIVFDSFNGNPNVATLRMLGRYQLLPHLSLFAGPTINVLYHFNIDDQEEDSGRRPGYEYSSYQTIDGHVQVMLWPGFALGVQF